jgi:hypothetical protein
MSNESFFSLAELKQPVNQWLCIGFMGVFCFWTLLYYFTQKTQIIGESYAADTNYYLQNGDIRPQLTHAKPAVSASPSANTQ